MSRIALLSGMAVVIAVSSCQTLAVQKNYSDLKAENYAATVDGKPVRLYTLTNHKGMTVRITNFGARVEQVIVPDKNGQPGDVVQGYDSLNGVISGQTYMGAFIGRYANRIGGGRFTLEGREYQLALNDSPNSLHGGKKGAQYQVFDAEQTSPSQLELDYTFRDGEEYFPGTVPIHVTYRVTDSDELVLEYSAEALDKTTVVSLTGHTYFNLSGDGSSSVLDHEVMINAGKVLEIDKHLIPTGHFRNVKNTPMDFRKPEKIGARIGQDYDLLRNGGGYDHTWVLDKKEGEFSLATRVHEPVSGRTLEVWSTEPGLQFYSGNFLEGIAPRDIGKGGAVYGYRSGFCMEPGHFPDSPNKPDFPSTVLKKGQSFHGKIVYRFSAG